MLFRSTSLLLAILLSGFLLGCSGSQTPIAPENQDYSPEVTLNAQTSEGYGQRVLWGMGQVIIDAVTETAEVIPFRTGMWHANINRFIEPPGSFTKISIKNLSVGDGIIDVEVGLPHPFFNLYQWSGFDARIALITDGSWDEFADDEIILSRHNEVRILNADGLTRWWNPREFPLSGAMGYNEGSFGRKDSIINYQSRLNPFKYYADDLGLNENFPQDLDPANRGMFSANSYVKWRHWIIDFGDPANWYVFNYSIDANHYFSPGQNGQSVVTPDMLPEWFAISANSTEPYAIVVNEVANSLYYNPTTHENGGDLTLDIEIYDWQGLYKSGGIPGEVSQVYIESPSLLDSSIVAGSLLAGTPGATYSTYRVEIIGASPEDNNYQDILLTAVSSNGSYNEGLLGLTTNFQGTSPLAAYFLYTPFVDTQVPVQTQVLDLLTPNGGDSYPVGTIIPITWTSQYIVNLDLEYSTNSGSTWNPIVTVTSSPALYNWDTAGLTPGTQYRIRISDANPDDDPFDTSDADFTLLAVETIDLISPNGGGSYPIGTPLPITWTSANIANIDIEFSTDSGGAWNPIQTVPATPASFSWNTSALIPGTQYRIRISDAVNNDPFDISAADFEMYDPQTIDLTSPNGGVYEFGDIIPIQWTWTGTISFVELHYSYNGTVWNPIGGGLYFNPPSPATINWDTSTQAGLTASETVYVRVRNAVGGVPSDQSSPSFALESLTVTSPNGGESITYQVLTPITWTVGTGAASVIPTVKIELSTDGGLTYPPIPLKASTPNDGSWNWPLPAPLCNNNAIIKISDAGTTGISDESNGNFSIVIPSLTLPTYLTYFTGGPYTYEGGNKACGTLPTSFYYGNPGGGWNFTTGLPDSIRGSTTFTVSTASGSGIAPLYWGAPAFFSNEYGMRASINGPNSTRPWWVFRFETGFNVFALAGTSGYRDMDGWYGTSEFVTHEWNIDPGSRVTFPINGSSGTTTLNDTGVMFYPLFGSGVSIYMIYPRPTYTPGHFAVLGEGPVTVPAGSYPHCLLIRMKIINIYCTGGLCSGVTHTGQIQYQWIDTASGKIVAYLETSNDIMWSNNFNAGTGAITGNAMFGALLIP